jgi:hypothetical protein
VDQWLGIVPLEVHYKQEIQEHFLSGLQYLVWRLRSKGRRGFDEETEAKPVILEGRKGSENIETLDC